MARASKTNEASLDNDHTVETVVLRIDDWTTGGAAIVAIGMAGAALLASTSTGGYSSVPLDLITHTSGLVIGCAAAVALILGWRSVSAALAAALCCVGLALSLGAPSVGGSPTSTGILDGVQLIAQAAVLWTLTRKTSNGLLVIALGVGSFVISFISLGSNGFPIPGLPTANTAIVLVRIGVVINTAGLMMYAAAHNRWLASSVGIKASLALSGLVALFLTWGATTFLLNNSVTTAAERIRETALPAEQAIERMNHALAQMNIDLLRYVLDDADARDSFPTHLLAFRAALRELHRLEAATPRDLSKLEHHLNHLASRANRDVFGAYNPALASWSRRQVGLLEKTIAKQLASRLEALVDTSDSFAVNPGATAAPASKSATDLKLELRAGVADMMLNLAAYIRSESTAASAFEARNREFLTAVSTLERKRGESLSNIRALHAALETGGRRLIDTFQPRAIRDATEVTLDLEAEAVVPLSQQLARILQSINATLTSELHALDQRAHESQLLLVGFSLASVIGAAIIIALTFSNLVRPIRNLNTRMLNLAAGDTRADISLLERADEVGQMARTINVFKDNALAQAQAEAEHHLQVAVENMPSGILMTDRHMVVKVVNGQFLDLYGLRNAGSAHDRPFLELIRIRAERGDYGPGDPLLLAEQRLKDFESRSFTNVDEAVVEGRHLEVTRVPLDGGGIITLATDISDRKMATESLRERSQLMTLMHHLATHANTATEVSAALSACLESVSHYLGACVAHAYLVLEGPEPTLGSADLWVDRASLSTSALRAQTKATQLKSGEGFAGHALQSRTPRWVQRKNWDANGPRTEAIVALGIHSTFAFPVLIGDKVVAVLEFFIEKDSAADPSVMQAAGQIGLQLGHVFERSRSQLALVEARDQAEAASLAKANFLATMSHEIRTPMNGVVGMVDMLSDEIEDADHRDMLNTIKDSSYSLLAIIDDILDFSKIEANKLRLESVAFSIAENIENSLATLSSTAARTGIELVACIDPSLRRAVLGDPVRLRQILINLCGNAIKFTRGAKPVVVQAQATTMHDDSVSVEIKVIDTGVGISREAQPNLFEPFSQAEASTTRKFGGTGLGLSICHRLTQLMAGEIGVRSTLGEGSEFWVRLTFPLTTQTQPTPPPPTLAGVRVVVISTVPSIHQACELNLEHHGATVIRARTAIARQFSPDDVVVLTDPLEVEDQVRDLCGRPDAQRPKTVAVIPPSHRASVVIDASAVRVRGNPIRHDDLLHSIARAAGRATGQTDFENDPTRVKAASRISLAPAGSDAPIILVAEDNTTNQAVIKRQLRVLGYDCEMAADGREALNLWLERRHRVVLTDLHMPEMDGFELTKAIRAHEALGGPVSTIAAVTASASTSEADRCREAGIDDCLFKPLEIGVLQRSLKRWTNAQDTSPSARAPTTSAPIELTPAKSAPVESAPVESAPVKSALVESAAKDHGAPCSAGPAVEHVTDEQPTPPNHSTSLADIAKSQIEKILRAADVGDSALVKTNTVSLKSAAEHSGHPPLVAACDRLLEAAEADDWPNLSRLLGTLPEALDARSEQRRPPGLNA